MYRSNGEKNDPYKRNFFSRGNKRYPARSMEISLTEDDSEILRETPPQKPYKKAPRFPAHAAARDERLYGSAAAARSRKRLLSRLGIFLCIAAAFAMLFVLLSGQNNYIPEDSSLKTVRTLRVEYDAFEEKTFFFTDGRFSDISLSEPVSDTQTNFEGTVSTVLTTTGALYYVTEEKFVQVADNVLQVVLSNYGDSIAFVSHEGDLSRCSIYLYHLSTGKTVRVDRMEEQQNVQLALSPNGEKLVYTKEEEDTRNLYLFDADRLKYVSPDMMCPVISDRGDIYAVGQKNGVLYFLTAEGSKINIASEVYPIFRLNCDNTEIVFPAGGKWYLSVQGKEKVEVGESTYFLPADSGLTAKSIYHSGSSHIISYALETLRGSYFLSAGGLVYLDEHNAAAKVIRDAEKIQLSEDGTNIYYMRSGKLYAVAADRPDETREIAEHVLEYFITKNGTLYYKDANMTLWSVKETQRTLISLNVEKAVMTPFDVMLFLTQAPPAETSALDTGILYSCQNENVIRKIADNVRALEVTETAVYYEVLRDNHDYFYDLYALDSDGNFTCVMEKIGLLPAHELKAKDMAEAIVGTWYVSEFRINGEPVKKQQVDDRYGAETTAPYTDLLLQFYPDQSAYRMSPLSWYRYEMKGNEITMLHTVNDSKIVLHYQAQEMVWEILNEENSVLELVLLKEPAPMNEVLQTGPKNIFEEDDTNYAIEIGGISCPLPLPYNEIEPLFLQLEAANWICDQAGDELQIEARSERQIWYAKPEGSIGFTFYNAEDTSKAFTDCPVTAIEIVLEEESDLDLVLPYAVRMLHTAPEDVRKRYGAPSNMRMLDNEITYGYRNHPFHLKLQFSGDDSPVLTGVKIETLNDT